MRIYTVIRQGEALLARAGWSGRAKASVKVERRHGPVFGSLKSTMVEPKASVVLQDEFGACWNQ